jgi:hypothetical protein
VFRQIYRPVALIASVGVALALGNLNALAYASGSIGYDLGYLQCGTAYPTGSFGIVGVDTGWPFISSVHPGNPCLADEYAQTPQAGLYINTGFDPTYTDSNHTTTDCASQSASVTGTPAQQAAWAAGCSEAIKDLTYVSDQAITNPAGWWLDVETANSWCGQTGTNCTDLTLNQYTLQGIIDTLLRNSIAPVGVYSTSGQWTSIVGSLSVSGVTLDWVASGARSAKRARTYCGSSFSLSGAPVGLVQYLTATADRDYAC